MAEYSVTVNGKVYDVVVEKKTSKHRADDLLRNVLKDDRKNDSVPFAKNLTASVGNVSTKPQKVTNGVGAGNTLAAPMPGKVIAIKVNVGDNVQTNQEIIIIEAMKMHNPLLAPAAGVVQAIYVDTGASVQAGQNLILIK